MKKKKIKLSDVDEILKQHATPWWQQAVPANWKEPTPVPSQPHVITAEEAENVFQCIKQHTTIEPYSQSAGIRANTPQTGFVQQGPIQQGPVSGGFGYMGEMNFIGGYNKIKPIKMKSVQYDAGTDEFTG